MKKRQYLLLVVLTIVAGLVGGAVSDWVFVARTAEAAKKVSQFEGMIPASQDTTHHKVITAEEFRLVDKGGRLLAELSISPTHTRDSEFLAQLKDWIKQSRRPLEKAYGEELKAEEFDFDIGGIPRLVFYNKKGKSRFLLTGSRLMLMGGDTNIEYLSLEKGGLTLFSKYRRTGDRNGEYHISNISLGYDSTGLPVLLLGGDVDSPGLSLSTKSLVLVGKGGKANSLVLEADNLRLSDGDGSKRAVLGKVDTEVIDTGEIRTRPESSLVLFDKEGRVVWSAP